MQLHVTAKVIYMAFKTLLYSKILWCMFHILWLYLKACNLCATSMVFFGRIVNFHKTNVRNNKSIQILQNYWANFNQTWQKASFGKGDTSLFKMKGHAFSKVGWYWHSENTLTTFKTLLLLNHLNNIHQIWHEASLGKGNSKAHALCQREIIAT